MSKGRSKFYFILLGIGIGLIFSGTYFYINPQIEYVEEVCTDEEILERAKVIKLESEIEKNNDKDNTEDNTDSTGNEGIEDKNESDESDEPNDIDDNNQGESNNEAGQAQEDAEEEQNEDSNGDPYENEEKQGEEANQPSANDDDANEITENTDNSDTTDENANDEEQIEYVTVKIEKGDLSEIIAKKLYEAGIIDDAGEFHKYIKDNKAEEKLDYGLFELKKGTDYKTLLELLTVN